MDLRLDVRKRKTWFYETQLRRLNLEAFRDEVRPDQPGPRLDLISEVPSPEAVPGQFSRPQPLGRVYRDSQQPVWTADDAARHGAFAASLIGRVGDFLSAREPLKLAERLKALRVDYEASAFGSVTDLFAVLWQFPRSRPEPDPDANRTDPARPADSKGVAISRAELAAAKPWLIPELYAQAEDAKDVRGWVTSLEHYIADFETELLLIVGGIAGTPLPFELNAPATYRGFLAGMLMATSVRSVDQSVKVRLLDLRKDKPEDKEAKYHYQFSIETNGSPMGAVANYRLSERVKYWSGVIHDALMECVALKPNSDMGLCQLVRVLYRYGTLPELMRVDGDPKWRRRAAPDETFNRFFAARATAIGDDVELERRFHVAETKLRIILEETATHPLSFDPSFSPLAGEILKQGLLSYKYWLDEQPRALRNDRLNKVKKDLGYGEDEVDHEMEFWSENHYIMFASSEYLLGQLWQDESFQPCRLFVDPGDTTGARTGVQRRDRGRARVLKWLNNRLMFGWMEFNSSGYYREHLWALLNLVDFALDDEVRTKATMAVDLMLFDVTRYLHRGAMGAAGGRSQFKSKSHGYDNGLTDIVEMMLGAKGVFAERDAQIAASFASSSYEVPRVLLEIGAAPPTYPFTDRSRVSITFDELAKYGITWSQDSVIKDSLMGGYAGKRARYSPFLAEVNKEIARTHDDYGQVEDDTIFFWGMSAFFNKQVVRNTNRVVKRFGLKKADAFKTTSLLLDLVSFFKPPGSALLGFSIADLPNRAIGAITGEGSDEVDEATADDLSLILEGSTRTRANIVTYRSPGAMQSSVQNFRYGQLNFQSSIQQATLNGAVNVFVTTGFGGIDISDLATFGVGALVGGIAFGPLGAVAGGIGAVVGEHGALQHTNPLNESHDDGPEWWTGYWAVPRVAQHGGATIMLSEFYDIQDFLAETGSHAWFPKSGFDRVVERRTSAYDDANFPLLDIGHIGPKGFWLFGKVVHPRPEGSSKEPEEGYVGVFSNKRPEWLTKDSDPYVYRLEQVIDEHGDTIWKDAPDLFADKDWYVNGKNIWIVQVGSRTEFGSFDAFIDRVSSARVHVDDTGDLECTYDVPRPGGGSDRLRVTNGDDAEFELNGQPLATDLFPRFENPFVRSGVVEWGQRTWCLEWNGHTLLHDFSDSTHPVRQELPEEKPGDAETIVALVIHLRTGDEAMDAFTVARATVDVGCQRCTTDQVVAAGPIGKNTQHDAEWIFFDQPIKRRPDMVLQLSHPASGGDPIDLSFLKPSEIADLNPSALVGPLSLLGEGGTPEWEASFSLKALMGDHRLRDCVLPFSQLDFEGDRRQSGQRPFSVRLSAWSDWGAIEGAVEIGSWLLAKHPPHSSIWHDHHDFFVVDRGGRLWHRRTTCGGTMGFWRDVDATGGAPNWTAPVSWAAVSDPAGQAQLFAVSEGRLRSRVGDANGGWSQPWTELHPLVPGILLPEMVPLGANSFVTAVPGVGYFEGTDVYITGGDGEIYLRRGWRPGDNELWRRLGTAGFDLASESPLRVTGRTIVARSQQAELWIRDLESSVLFGGGWQKLDTPGFAVHAFSIGGSDDELRLAVRGPAGQVSIGESRSGSPVQWRPTRAEDDWQPAVETDLAWAVPEPGSASLFASGVDGTVRVLTDSDSIWRDFGRGMLPHVGTASRLEIACRMPGQVEVFTQTSKNDLVWTWWS